MKRTIGGDVDVYWICGFTQWCNIERVLLTGVCLTSDSSTSAGSHRALLFVLFIPALHDFTNAERFGALGQIAYLSTGLLSPLLLAFNCASIWTICYISVKRHKAILRPLSSIHAPSRPFSPLLAIAAAALIFNGSKWAEFRWLWIDVEVDNVTRMFLAHEPSDLAYNETYRQL
ncbi:hypothetical protein OSTOST_18863, partial [Ostertagia ostertagi]